jgi:hypothetical protein
MTRAHYNARYNRRDRPTDQVPPLGYNEHCRACRCGFPHTWKRHDRAIEKYAPKQDPRALAV